MVRSLSLLFIFITFLGYSSLAQEEMMTANAVYEADSINKIHYGLTAMATGTSGGKVPFWMRSNQYGSVPLDGLSSSLIGRVERNYQVGDQRLVDWGAGVEGRLNMGNRVRFDFIEAYIKARLSIFQLKVGRSRDITGLVDSTLSSGSYAISGNALGIPKIEISVPDYWNIPLTNEIIALKGNFVHGWMGKVPIQFGLQNGSEVATYFHQLSLYGRIGKPSWRLKLYGGINHEVIWGNDHLIYPDLQDLSTTTAFLYVVTGKRFGGARDVSKIGNQLGSIDAALTYDFDDFRIMAYRQQFYEKGAIYYLANIADGLTGISFVNKRNESSSVSWRKFLVEVFYSKHQAGEEGSKATPSGPEFYYNHGVYKEGYSYNGMGIGTPLITPYKDGKDHFPRYYKDYFVNNRVLAIHFGSEFKVKEWNCSARLTFSRNWGDYHTSDVPYFWFAYKKVPRRPDPAVFIPVNQFSGYFEASRALRNGFRIGVVLAGDYGDLLYNTAGGFIKLSKSW
jgi:hypothetical protein